MKTISTPDFIIIRTGLFIFGWLFRQRYFKAASFVLRLLRQWEASRS